MAKKRRGDAALLDRWWKKFPRVYLRYHSEHGGVGRLMIDGLYAKAFQERSARRIVDGIRA